MKYLKGLYTDNLPIDQPAGTWRDARNIVISNKKGSITNEDGFEVFSENYPEELRPLGAISVKDEAVVIFSVGTPHEIGIVDKDGNYTTIIADDLLNFNEAFPISGTFKYNSEGELVIVFTDFYNPPRILNKDNLPFQLDVDYSLLDATQINKINLFPEVDLPSVVVNNVSDYGGSLKSGVIYIVTAYKNDGIGKTNWLNISNPIFITDDTSTEKEKYDGVEPDKTTSKSIDLKIEDLDSRFDSVLLAAIHKIGGVITCYQFAELPIEEGSSEVSYTFTGGEDVETLTIDEVISERVSYPKVKAFTQLNDRLYGANVESFPDVDYQKYANLIEVEYVTSSSSDNFSTSFKNPAFAYKRRGFMADEVYALYICLVFKDGTYSKAFHIPGRPPAHILYSSLGVVFPEQPGAYFTENAKISDIQYAQGNNPSELVYLDEDQEIDTNIRYFHTRNTSDNSEASTNMGFWENENEVYPNTSEWDSSDIGGEDLRGQKVRHHKMPSKRTMGVSADTAIKRTIGIRVSNIIIPEELEDRVQGYEVFYAKRTSSNATIVGQSLFQYAGVPEDEGGTGGLTNIVWTTCGNWIMFTPTDQAKRIYIDKQWARFHPFDMLLVKPSVQPVYFTNEFKLAIDHLQDSYESYGEGSMVVAGGDVWNYVVDYHASDYVTRSITNESNFLRKIENFRYFPHNVIIEEDGKRLYNLNAEECILCKISNGDTLDIAITNFDIDVGESSNGLDSEETFISNLRVLNKNPYKSFDQQDLVSTGVFENASSSYITYGGDTFVTPHYSTLVGPRDRLDTSTEETHHKVIIHKGFTAETINHSSLRHELEENEYTKYYPKSDPSFGNNLNRAQPISIINYNNDYTSVNDLNKVFPRKNNSSIGNNKFPYRIIRSRVSSREELEESWATFDVNDYYEMPKNKGEIVNIEAYGQKLLIHLENALFLTISKDTLKSGSAEIVIGTGDIFERDPEEVITSRDGYGGTQHKFSCLLTKAGYFFVDANHGKVFLFTEQLIEISKLGMEDFFRENLFTEHDNPFFRSGLTVAYDERYNRLLLSRKGVSKYYNYTTRVFDSPVEQEVYYALEEGITYKITIIAEGTSDIVLYYLGSDEVVFHYEDFNEYFPELEGNKTISYVTAEQNAEGFYINGANNSQITITLEPQEVELSKSESTTISYSLDTNSWISFHDYNPDFLIGTKNRLMSFKEGKIFRHNIETIKGKFYTEDDIFDSTITIVFNQEADKTKVFSALKWQAEVIDPEGVSLYTQTINKILLYTSYHCSGLVQLENLKNMRNVLGTWHFNSFRDLVKDRSLPFIKDNEVIEDNLDTKKAWFNKRRFEDKFLIAKFIIDNTDQNTIHISNFDADMRLSYR